MESKDQKEKVIHFSLASIPFFDELKDSNGVLLSGCGGGYDIYCGIPLYFALKNMGVRVYLSNLTFSDFARVNREFSKEIEKDCLEITSKSTFLKKDQEYFPERHLSTWFKNELSLDVPVYMLNRTGCVPLTKSYKALASYLKIDTIVLIDGGTDSLMRGDEWALGSPHEDIASIAAVDQVDVPKKYLACLGFGVDHFHGVSHSLFLENVASLIKLGGFLGTFSVIKEMIEAKYFKEACEFAFKKMQTSIVNGSISAAIEGHYGDHKFTGRTGDTKLFINPLMSMYWCFRLKQVADTILSLEAVKKTNTYWELDNAIYETARKGIKIREHVPIPL